ncbi:unnamed protein product, partial [Cylicostephanus goldi]
ALRRHPQIAAWRRSKRQAPAWTFQLLHDYYDEFYLGTVAFGNPGQELWLAMDTGSSIIWVIDDACDTAECNGYPKSGLNKRKFRKDLSRTFTSTNRSFVIHYHTGWTAGIAAQDTVRFGVANKVAPFLARIPIEGVFGLGLPSKTASGNVTYGSSCAISQSKANHSLDEQKGLIERTLLTPSNGPTDKH